MEKNSPLEDLNSEVNSEKLDNLFSSLFNFIKSHLPLNEFNKPKIRITMFNSFFPIIIKSNWAESVSDTFQFMKENIKSLETEGVHVLYVIDIKDSELLNIEKNIPFANCLFC